jgi:hypothetical protein
MQSKQLSPFDQAMKEIGLITEFDSRIKEGTRLAIRICLGKLTIASKCSKKEREDNFECQLDIEKSIHDITGYVQRISFLKPIWEKHLPVFIKTLL